MKIGIPAIYQPLSDEATILVMKDLLYENWY